jgi:GNAT superfamily N-acetyltransferase
MEKIEFMLVTDEKLIVFTQALADEIWREHYQPILGLAQVEYMLKNLQSKEAISGQIREGYLYYLIKSSVGWLGYLAVNIKAEELFLSKLYLLRQYRGKSYGRQAINFIEGLAKLKGLKKISLTVNRHNASSIEAYRKFGFLISGAQVQDIGSGFSMDDYLMCKAV